MAREQSANGEQVVQVAGAPLAGLVGMLAGWLRQAVLPAPLLNAGWPGVFAVLA